tara:strand:+ start:705 stop:962 length:258 start_codon:yes stop_codon:yes gene_type:complete
LPEITHSDLVEAVQQALAGATVEDGHALTVNELCDALDISHKTVWTMLRQLIGEGSAECVKVRRINITGQSQKVPGYRIKQNVVQ